MKSRALTMLILAIGFCSTSDAQVWTSPDGFLKLKTPDPSALKEIPNPPRPFIALWSSRDESIHFAVLTMRIPPNSVITQSAAEEGLAEETGGEVVRLSNRVISGREVWTMRAKGSPVQITQSIVRNHDVLYKVMATSLGDPANDTLVGAFIGSLSLADTANAKQVSYEQSLDGRRSGTTVGIDTHDLSKQIGGAGALLAIGLFVYVVTRRRRETTATYTIG